MGEHPVFIPVRESDDLAGGVCAYGHSGFAGQKKMI